MPQTLWLSYNDDSACPYYRFLLPARYCAAAFAPLDCEIAASMGVNSDADIIGLHGLPSYNSLMTLARFKRNGGKVVWSVDDDWLTIPEWNPAYPTDEGRDSYWLSKELADFILVSTPAIADSFADVSHKVLTAPNLLDLDVFPPMPDRITEVRLPVQVCWVGGRCHKGDVELMPAVIDRCLRKLGKDKVSFFWMGMHPPGHLIRDWLHRGFIYQPSLPFSEYLKRIGTLAADIYLCPLADIPFNYSKSNLRILESWALMAAPVASPVGEYNCVAHNKDGKFADTVDAWVAAVTRLATDHEYRIDIAAAGRRRVESEFSWRRPDCHRPWLDAFARIFGVSAPVV